MSQVVNANTAKFGLFQAFVKYPLADIVNVKRASVLIVKKQLGRFAPAVLKGLFFTDDKLLSQDFGQTV